MDDHSCGIATMEKLVGRSGAIAHVGIINQSSLKAKFASSSVICDLNDLPKDTQMLFAAPLQVVNMGRDVDPGANLFDLAIQGYSLFPDAGREVKRNFEYIFKMATLRIADLEHQLGDAEKVKTIADAATRYMTAIQSLPENDVQSAQSNFSEFDQYLNIYIDLKILTNDGTIIRPKVKLTALSAALWLANYLTSRS